MEFFTKHLSLLALTLLMVVSFYGPLADACSCQYTHPQTHYCTADYVVQLRVLRKSNTIEADKTTYKVHIKRTYKATPEARRMLRDGRITTPQADSMCGVKLDVGRVYIIAGRLPQLNACSYYKEYIKMSIGERHGFSSAYRLACKCSIRSCGKRCGNQRDYIDECKWPFDGHCERDYSACVPHNKRTRHGTIEYCGWRRTQLYKKCLN